MQKIFIAGGSGYIGNAVAQAFARKGDSVACLCNTHKSENRLRQQGLHAVVGDMAEPQAWLSHAVNADIVVHAAHLRPGMRLSESWLRKAAALRDTALPAMIEAAQKNGRCKALIYTSGMIAHGDHGDMRIDEDTPDKDSALGAYHRTGEKMIEAAAARGLPALSIRPGMVYGPGGTFGKFFLSVAARGRYQYPGTGSNYLPFIHIEDLAQAYLLAAAHPPVGQVVSVVDDEPITVRQMAATLLASFNGGRASSVPTWLIGLFAGRPLTEMLTGSYRIRNDKAKRLLGWEPEFKSFAQGIQSVVDSYKQLRRA